MGIEKVTKDLIKKVASQIVKKEIEDWPPNCIVLTYQPRRPEQAKEITLHQASVDD